MKCDLSGTHAMSFTIYQTTRAPDRQLIVTPKPSCATLGNQRLSGRWMVLKGMQSPMAGLPPCRIDCTSQHIKLCHSSAASWKYVIGSLHSGCPPNKAIMFPGIQRKTACQRTRSKRPMVEPWMTTVKKATPPMKKNVRVRKRSSAICMHSWVHS